MTQYTDEMGLELMTGASRPDEAFDRDMKIIDKGGAYGMNLAVDGDLGQWFRQDSSGNAVLAQADTEANSLVMGVLTLDGAAGADRSFRYDGCIEKAAWGLTPLTQYYLSPSTPGAMTATKPSSTDCMVKLGESDATGNKFYIRIRIYSAGVATHSLLANLAWSVAGHTIDATIASLVADGVAPMTTVSTATCTNLNADLLDGNHASAFAVVNHNHNGVYQPLNATLTELAALADADGVLTNTAGVLSWTAGGGGGGTPGGTPGAVQFNNAGVFGGDATNLFWDNANKWFGLGTATPTTKLTLNIPATSFNSLYILGGGNNYLQANIKNTTDGINASSDWVATADTGTELAGYINMGINSSTYNQAAFNIGGPLDGYLYSVAGPTGVGGNLAIGTATPHTVIKFHTAGTTAANERMRITAAGFVGVGTATPNNKLQVAGMLRCDPAAPFQTRLGESAGGTGTGTFNTIVGYNAGLSLGAGASNSFFGANAGRALTSGNYNVAMGDQALTANTTGANNVAVGYRAGFTGSGLDFANNTFVGYMAGQATTINGGNTFIGSAAGYDNIIGANNTYMGANAGKNTTAGAHNTVIGYDAGRYGNLGTGNTLIGSQASYLMNGSNNTVLGRCSGVGITSGSNNTILGTEAGNNLTTGSNNIVIGHNANAPSATANNQMSIGNLIYATGGFGTGATIGMGNVGIKNNAPSASLSIGDGTGVTASLGLNFGDAAANLYRNADGSIKTDGNFNVGTLRISSSFIQQDGIDTSISLRGYQSALAGYAIKIDNRSVDMTWASGVGGALVFPSTLKFVPTIGTGVWNGIDLSFTINQTGGANGITRGLYIAPTLTAAADFCAIETTRGAVIFRGAATDSVLSVAGVGRRMIWYSRKAAFRAGYVNGSQWDDATIGECSTAMGGDTIASGRASAAMGVSTMASGYASTAMGVSTMASGYASTAMGLNTTANGYASTAMGASTTANGHASTAMGLNTTASGRASTAMGTDTRADGDYSFVCGCNMQATSAASNSFVIGYSLQVVSIATPNVFLIDPSDHGYSVGIGVLVPNSKFHVNGPIATAVNTVTAAYTVTAADSVIRCDATTVAFTVILPTASGIVGRKYTIKKIDASANSITVDAAETETIDGAATFSLPIQWRYVSIVSNGTNWEIVANN